MVDAVGTLLVESDRLEESAARAEGARSLRDDKHVFGTVPLDDIQSNIAPAINCMDSTGQGGRSIGVVLIAHPDLAAKGPEGTRHHSWIFNCAGLIVLIVDETEIGGISVSVHQPHAAAGFTGHDHIKVKRAFMIEGNPGMVR